MSIGLSPPYENINTAQQPIEQEQKTAANEVLKFSLGLTTDTLDNRTFADIDKQNTWKYNSNAPFLVKPALSKERVLTEDLTDEELESAINSLLQNAGLSEETLDKLAEMNRLKPEERNPTGFPGYEVFYAFLEVMKNAAKFKIGTEKAFGESKSEAAMNEAILNGRIPEIVSNNASGLSNEFIAEARSILSDLGANTPGFDALNRDLSELSEVING
ncbi:MAG: hypothetical protein ACK4HV_09275 [Parachlamydiaceae bacterium]